jgi:AraC-like DNA-binding protein
MTWRTPYLHFSTDDVPEQNRIAVWREQFGRTVLGLRFDPARDVPFEASVTLHALGGLDIASGSMSAARHERTRELTADGNDDLYLVIVNGSVGLVSQRGREIAIGDGDAFLIGAGDAYTLTTPATARICSLRVPCGDLAPLVPGIDDAIMRPIERSSGGLRLLIDYVALIKREHVLAVPKLRRLVVTHVHDLIALVIDGASETETHGLRAARLSMIKADVIENLGCATLSAATIAARHHLSRRYVQMLFEGEGTTFSQFVLGERLAHAHRRLVNSVCGHLSISAIALEAGFGDLSYFNRTFHRHYGATPSDVRAAAHRTGDKVPPRTLI